MVLTFQATQLNSSTQLWRRLWERSSLPSRWCRREWSREWQRWRRLPTSSSHSHPGCHSCCACGSFRIWWWLGLRSRVRNVRLGFWHGSGLGSGAGAGSGAGKYGSGSGMGSGAGPGSGNGGNGAGAGPIAYAPPPMASPPPHPLPPPPPPMYAAPAPPPTCALNVIKDATFSTASPQATSFVTVTIGVPSSQKLQLGSGSGEYGGGPALPLPAGGGTSAAPGGGGPGVAPGNGGPGVGPRGAPGGTPGSGPDPGTGTGEGSGVAPGNGSPGSEPGTAPAPAQVTTALAPRRRPSFLLLTAILLAALISLLPRLVFKDSASPVPSHSDLEAAFFGPLIRTETGLFRFQG